MAILVTEVGNNTEFRKCQRIKLVSLERCDFSHFFKSKKKMGGAAGIEKLPQKGKVGGTREGTERKRVISLH